MPLTTAALPDAEVVRPRAMPAQTAATMRTVIKSLTSRTVVVISPSTTEEADVRRGSGSLVVVSECPASRKWQGFGLD